MTLALTVLSTTTQAPPLSSACGGMYTNTGCLYTTRASTIRAPYLSTCHKHKQDEQGKKNKRRMGGLEKATSTASKQDDKDDAAAVQHRPC